MRYSLFNILSRISSQLSFKSRVGLLLLIALMLLNGIAELVTLASIIPFLRFLDDGSSNNLQGFLPLIPFLNRTPDHNLIVITSTVLFCLIIISASIIRLVNFWFSNILSAKIGTEFGSRIFSNVIRQDFKYHININSSFIITVITSHVSSIVVLVNNFLLFLSSLIISISLIVGLLVLDFKLSSIAITFFVISYLLVFTISKKRIANNGQTIANQKNYLTKYVQESLSSIRDIILNHRYVYYEKHYRNIDSTIRFRVAENSFLSIYPRFVLESFGLIFLAVTGAVLVLNIQNTESVIIKLGILAFGAQRLLPLLQQIYSQLTKIRGLYSAADQAICLLELPTITGNESIQIEEVLNFNKSLEFKNVSYQYVENFKVLTDINLTIKPCELIGLIGTTGSGKSTLIDIAMLFLEPSAGSLVLDNKLLSPSSDETLTYQWRKSISLVPQSLFLADCSIKENIAFGHYSHLIDHSKIKLCAKIAQIDEFIETLPDKYNTFVGERGVKLSGGQLQRIGIARALYSDPKFLIMDESTSALDPNTEKLVINSIRENCRSITILMISHRMESLKYCDQVIELKGGKINNIYSRENFSKLLEA